jgi:competence protein ComEA
LGVFIFRNSNLLEKDKIEIIKPPEDSGSLSGIVVEIAGSVEKPGVYKMGSESRIDELLIASGGLSVDADRIWVEKYINRAAKLIDGQKLYIKSVDEHSDGSTANADGVYQNVSPVLGVENQGLLNINSCTFSELDKLPGIGQVYGQKIIEQRPYSDVGELLSRKVLPKSNTIR